MTHFSIRLRKIVLGTFATLSVALLASQASAQGWVNPEIYNSGRRITDARYDPFSGQIIVRTDNTKIRESYLDPNRNQIDPGSYRQVNRYETDVNGVRWHVTGTQWTSNGVPHGNLSRRRIVNNGGITEDRNEHVGFSVGGPSSGSKSNSSRSTTTPKQTTVKPHRSINRSGFRGFSPF